MNHLYMCAICQVEIETLAKRRKVEVETFIKVGRSCNSFSVRWSSCYVITLVVSCLQLNKEFQAEEAPGVILCISMQWFREWESFVKGKDNGKREHSGVSGSPLWMDVTLFGCLPRASRPYRQQ